MNLTLYKVQDEFTDKSKFNQSLQDKLNEAQKNLNTNNKIVKVKDDTIEMLNIIVENKKKELLSIKNEIIELKLETGGESHKDVFKCNQCDYEPESKKGLKIHLARMHEVKCDKCGEMFGGERNLKTHMCRISIANPTCFNLYTKSWSLEN